MKSKHHAPLTSAEISSLWTSFIGDSMSICVLSYFYEKVEDPEIKNLLKFALKLSNEHVSVIDKIYQQEGLPTPKGFSNKEDVNVNAPRLFNDTLYLYYLKNMTKAGLTTYAIILPNMSRLDIREFFSSCLASSTELYNEVTDLLLKKGLEIRAPQIPYHKEITFVEKQSFLAGWLGEQRPLTGTEIMYLHANIQTNNIGQAIALGFAQVAQDQEVKAYMKRGSDIAKKHIELFSKQLLDHNLPAPMSSHFEVLPEKIPPFSDKLMMYHTGLMSSAGMGNYGISMSLSQRRDLVTNYARLVAEVGTYADDGLSLMIKHAWLERPPHA
ncbi:DUF3231 family protein [Halalkalibacter krulwichiae]|uniref:DUF3231 family protein n=1 Tax=Halalkalibacter krulwichiae TaxID=199441 RepID=A0A1X9MLE8_9BACI|nr:DUF3231 family protein [Halalkalibacter krulwichiae]ARK32671.1 hypothetical protein BkAM31D_24010 [Halalkalibacter krulwichiae]